MEDYASERSTGLHVPGSPERRAMVEKIALAYAVPPWLIDVHEKVPGRFSLRRLRWRRYVRRLEKQADRPT